MELIDALFCDDIRHEINNKVSLMGLYNDRIILNVENSAEIKWPIPVNLSTLLRFKLDESEKSPVQFIFEYLLNGKTLVKIEGSIDLDNKQKTLMLALAGNGIPLEQGDLGFSIKIYNGNKIYLSEIRKSVLKVMKR